jgi:glycerate-2-kinase
MTPTNLRDDFQKVLERGLCRVSPSFLLQSAVTRGKESITLSGPGSRYWDTAGIIPDDSRIFVAAVGKGALNMAKGLVEVLQGSNVEIVKGSMILSNQNLDISDIPRDFDHFTGSHPFPGYEDIANTSLLLERISGVEEGLVVLFLLSGGASSLLFKPRSHIPMVTYIDVVKKVMLNGGTIQELNTVRTFMSDVKGGGLCRSLVGKKVISLVLSDVMGDDPRFIGSGPTFPWEPDPLEVATIMESYGIDKETISKVLGGGSRDPLPRMDLKNILIGNNDAALYAISDEFEKAGWGIFTNRDKFHGEARETGLRLLRIGRHTLGRTGCDGFIQGGETTVAVRGKGIGGRNSEMGTYLIPYMKESETVICLATDGKDGSWEGAGMMVDVDIDKRGLTEALEHSDTGSYAKKSGSAIITGPTGNNLGDVFILLRSPPRGPPHHRK